MARETQKAQIERLQNEIKELKKLNDNILKANMEVSQELRKLQENEEETFRQLPMYKQMMDEISRLKVYNGILQRQLDKARKKNDHLIDQLNERPEQTHNARGAGRKPHDEKQQDRYRKFEDLLAEQKSMNEIMDIMKISRSTYYNYYRKLTVQKNNYLDSADN